MSNRLIVVLAVVAGLSLVVGSGAFNALVADRTASMSVAGDDSALLIIEPHSSQTGSDVFLDNGQLKISVGAGTTTTYSELFNITNQGTQPVAVWIEDIDYTGGGTGGNLAGDIIGNLDEDNTGNVTFFNPSYGGNQSCENGVASIEGQGNAVELSPGQTLVVSLKADSDDVSGEEADLLDEMTIYADATVNGVSSQINTAC